MTKKKTVPLQKEGFITGIAYDPEKELYGITCSDSYIHFYQQSKVRLEYLDNAMIWTGEMRPRAKIKDNRFSVRKVYNNDNQVIKEVIDKIWRKYDDDNSGSLDKEETFEFVQDCLKNIGQEKKLNQDNFDEFFDELDTDNSGTIEKGEMTDFIRSIVGKDTKI